MFEGMTYEYLLEKALEKVPNNMDKREGSVIYDAIAPAMAELADAYIYLNMVLEEAFGVTASYHYLALRAYESGILPYPASKAVLKGEFFPKELVIKEGTRFRLEDANYIVLEKIEDGVYKLECETEGIKGNQQFGMLIPIDYIEGLKRAELTEVLIPGIEEETEDHFRERYFSLIQKPSTSGNKYDYYNWAMECLGVGAVKVFPLALGPGTVKLVIADVDKRHASEELLNKVKQHIEEIRPIGAEISVVSVKEKKISVTANIKLKNGLVLGAVQEAFQQLLEDYFIQNSFDMTYVSSAKLGNILLDTIGVEDYSDLKLNNQTANIPLEQEEVAVVGLVELGVI